MKTWDGRGNDSHGRPAFIGEYGLEGPVIAYENQMAGEEMSMQGFWRPHRPY